MDPFLIFTLCNAAVLPFWLLLVVAPGWIWTERLVHSLLVPVALGTVYGVVGLGASGPENASMGSLEGVMALFSMPEAVLAGWVHYLVFDLFVGAWEVRDARRLEIAQWMVVPCLVLTLMLGPLGLAAYCALRAVIRGRYGFEEVRAPDLDHTRGLGARPAAPV